MRKYGNTDSNEQHLKGDAVQWLTRRWRNTAPYGTVLQQMQSWLADIYHEQSGNYTTDKQSRINLEMFLVKNQQLINC